MDGIILTLSNSSGTLHFDSIGTTLIDSKHVRRYVSALYKGEEYSWMLMSYSSPCFDLKAVIA